MWNNHQYLEISPSLIPDTLEKITINKEDGIAKVKELLTTIQKNLYDRAKNRRDSMIYKLNTYEELKEMAKNYGKENDEAFLKNENVRKYIKEGLASEKAMDFLVKNAKIK